MDQWEVIRLRCVRDGEPIKVVARELGLAPNTVRKYVRGHAPPRSRPRRRAYALDPYSGVIDELLRGSPKITAVRIRRLLIEQHGLSPQIAESTVRKYVGRRRAKLVPKEAFVRARYAPGHQAQMDFSPMPVLLANVPTTVQVFSMRLSYSTRFFARASLRCDQPALFTGMVQALQAFGGVPRVVVFDNASTAVRRVLRGRERVENEEFRAFRGALALEVEYAAPARGNEKGGVEGQHAYLERNFFTPVPAFADLTALNAALARFCEQDERERVHATHHERVADRFTRETAALRPLPTLPRPCVTRYAHVNKYGEVTLEGNRYSVPTEHAFREALVEVYDDRVDIVVGEERVASHRRLAGTRQESIDPRHVVDLIRHKHRSALTALAFSDDRLPPVLLQLRDRLIERDGPTATKGWMKLLALAKTVEFDRLAQATAAALSAGTLDVDAIALLVHQPERDAPSAQPFTLAPYRIAAFVEQPA